MCAAHARCQPLAAAKVVQYTKHGDEPQRRIFHLSDHYLCTLATSRPPHTHTCVARTHKRQPCTPQSQYVTRLPARRDTADHSAPLKRAIRAQGGHFMHDAAAWRQQGSIMAQVARHHCNVLPTGNIGDNCASCRIANKTSYASGACLEEDASRHLRRQLAPAQVAPSSSTNKGRTRAV